jgi:hypothetical protein
MEDNLELDHSVNTNGTLEARETIPEQPMSDAEVQYQVDLSTCR